LLQNKISIFLAQGICFYVGHSFPWNTDVPTPLICPKGKLDVKKDSTLT
jgi:hypothetical protein